MLISLNHLAWVKQASGISKDRRLWTTSGRLLWHFARALM